MDGQGRREGRQEYFGGSSSRGARQAAPASSESNIPSLPFVNGVAPSFAGNAFGFAWVYQYPIYPMSMPVVVNPHVGTIIYPPGSIYTSSSSTIYPFFQPGSSTQFVPLIPVIQYTPDWNAWAQNLRVVHSLNIIYQQPQVIHFVEETQDNNRGLSEEVITNNIKHEKFEITGEVTPGNEEICVICQENIVSEEEVGKLDNCAHQFHIGCITKWLVNNNVCPICKQCGLSV